MKIKYIIYNVPD